MAKKKKEKKKEPTKQELLKEEVKRIAKALGESSIMMLGDKGFKVPCEVISTGSLMLDLATGVGGFPRGRITEIYGNPAVGKTTLALQAVANIQKESGTAAFIDAEHALDPIYCKALGVDLDKCAISQPDHGEQALEVAEQLIRSTFLDILVVDSVAALTPKAEIDGEMGAKHVGLQARLMNQAMRKLTAFIHKTNTCVIFTNQLRDKIGVTWGSPVVTPGGHALKFNAAIRLEVKSIGKLKTGDVIVGNRTRVLVGKNKVAVPHRLAEFDILSGHGVNYEGEVIDLGLEEKITQQSGSWFNYGEVRLGQGRGNACTFLRENPELRDEIKDKALSSRSSKDTEEPCPEDNGDGEDSVESGGAEGEGE